MTTLIPVAVSPLRQRLIDEMDIRRFGFETQRNYIRDVGRFATFLGRSPDTATAEDVRRFQIEQSDLSVPAPTMNAIVSALRFFFIQTLDRPELARKLVRMRYERKLPVVLSQDEVAQLLAATTCLKHQPALSVAYGAGLPVLRRAHGRCRDLRASASAPRAASSCATIRDAGIVTRHGLTATDPAAPVLAEPERLALIAVRDAATPSRAKPSAPADPTSPRKSGPSASRSALASTVPPNTGADANP